MADFNITNEIFNKIRNEKRKFFAKEENSDYYFDMIKKFMLEQMDFDLSYYRDNYLKGRLHSRIKGKKFGNFQAYYLLLKQDPREVQMLKNILTIHTTEFFRDRTPFRYLEKTLFPKLAEKYTNKNQPIRILSSPCSTGQEVYSLAIIIHFLKTTKKILNPVEIYGIDIDLQSVETAKKGIYKKDSISNISPESLERNFNVHNEYFLQIKPEIAQYCRFSVHDIFKPLPFNMKFDLIACRNFLIYISKEDQLHVIQKLIECADKETYFMLGMTEGLNLMNKEDFAVESLKDHIYQYKGTSHIVGNIASDKKKSSFRIKREERKSYSSRKTPLTSLTSADTNDNQLKGIQKVSDDTNAETDLEKDSVSSASSNEIERLDTKEDQKDINNLSKDYLEEISDSKDSTKEKIGRESDILTDNKSDKISHKKSKNNQHSIAFIEKRELIDGSFVYKELKAEDISSELLINDLSSSNDLVKVQNYQKRSEIIDKLNEITENASKKDLNQQSKNKTSISVPKIDPKTAINSFIDNKTGQINQMIQKAKEIQKLKEMSNSVIDEHVQKKTLDILEKRKLEEEEQISQLIQQAQFLKLNKDIIDSESLIENNSWENSYRTVPLFDEDDISDEGLKIIYEDESIKKEERVILEKKDLKELSKRAELESQSISEDLLLRQFLKMNPDMVMSSSNVPPPKKRISPLSNDAENRFKEVIVDEEDIDEEEFKNKNINLLNIVKNIEEDRDNEIAEIIRRAKQNS